MLSKNFPCANQLLFLIERNTSVSLHAKFLQPCGHIVRRNIRRLTIMSMLKTQTQIPLKSQAAYPIGQLIVKFVVTLFQ